MSDYDYTARRYARNAESRANDAVNYAERLERQLRDLMSQFNSAVSRIKELEQEVAKLKEELAPKKLDKPANQFPLKNKD
ncbi:MAG: hypothetical protein K8R48_08000 [Alphaproteobacteria bacterium]|nr:hypothetical protein [Alphaproteobacteria bacterium]